jgi:ABC-type multidrug transport system permease subunit
VLVLSGFLGGVYYPTHVIPSWLQNVSAFLPLTYGLRALRQTLLEGLPLRAVLPDVLVLVAFVALLFLVGAFAFRQALRYARRTGTLAQY